MTLVDDNFDQPDMANGNNTHDMFDMNIRQLENSVFD